MVHENLTFNREEQMELKFKKNILLLDAEAAFVAKVSEEQLRNVDVGNVSSSYGTVAALVADGVVARIVREAPSASDLGGNRYRDFFKRAREAMLGVLGESQKAVSAYLITDLADLNVVTIRYPISLPDHSNSELKVSFWVNTLGEGGQDLGTFLQNVVADQSQLTVSDFLDFCAQRFDQLAQEYGLRELAQSSEFAGELQLKLRKTTGISCRLAVNFKRAEKRIISTLTSKKSPVTCPKCHAGHEVRITFCTNCGEDLNDVSLWMKADRPITSYDGKKLSIQTSVLVDPMEFSASDEGLLEATLIDALTYELSRYTFHALATSEGLARASEPVSHEVARVFGDQVSDLQLLDLREKDAEWTFGVEHLIEEEVRRISANKNSLRVDIEKLELDEAAFEIATRRANQQSIQRIAGRRLELDERKVDLEIDVEAHRVASNASSQHSDIDFQDTAREHSNRVTLARLRDNDLRKDQLEQLTHETELEMRAKVHDVQLNKQQHESELELRRNESRLNHETALSGIALDREKRGIEEGSLSADAKRQLEKLEAMAAMEARMASQDHEFELTKKDKLRGLASDQILAMQAAEIATQDGGSGVLAELAKSIATAEAGRTSSSEKMMQEKERLYEQMLSIQRDSMLSALDAHKSASELVQKTSSEALEHMGKLASGKSDTKAGNAVGKKKPVSGKSAEKKQDDIKK